MNMRIILERCRGSSACYHYKPRHCVTASPFHTRSRMSPRHSIDHNVIVSLRRTLSPWHRDIVGRPIPSTAGRTTARTLHIGTWRVILNRCSAAICLNFSQAAHSWVSRNKIVSSITATGGEVCLLNQGHSSLLISRFRNMRVSSKRQAQISVMYSIYLIWNWQDKVTGAYIYIYSHFIRVAARRPEKYNHIQKCMNTKIKTSYIKVNNQYLRRTCLWQKRVLKATSTAE